jgi:hypothetical protein
LFLLKDVKDKIWKHNGRSCFSIQQLVNFIMFIEELTKCWIEKQTRPTEFQNPKGSPARHALQISSFTSSTRKRKSKTIKIDFTFFLFF